MQPPMLALPDFSSPFIVECDALGFTVRVVLMQKWRSLDFFSQSIKGRTKDMPNYEKELYAIVAVVHKWRPYILGQPFVIRTNQQSLKYLQDHKVGTPVQQKWVIKLLGYYFLVEYKRGTENRVDDALSQNEVEEKCSFSLISFPTMSQMEELRAAYEHDEKLHKLLSQCKKNELALVYSMRGQLLLYKNDYIFLHKNHSRPSCWS